MGTLNTKQRPGHPRMVASRPGCHSERSEESLCPGPCYTQNHGEILRFAQNDSERGWRSQDPQWSALSSMPPPAKTVKDGPPNIQNERPGPALAVILSEAKNLSVTVLAIRKTTERFFASLRMTASGAGAHRTLNGLRFLQCLHPRKPSRMGHPIFKTKGRAPPWLSF